jgi:type VI secretion system protein ImpM
MLTRPVQAPGFFGKVPGRGDFLTRRVPATLLADWEAWLAGLVVAAREALGESWPDDWLTAPLWHFVLGSGVSPPNGAAGVLVASADRVGRLFPFTIIGAADRWHGSDRTALNGWARSAEALTLSALDDDFDPEALDAALLALGPPAVPGGEARAPGHWLLTLDGDWPSEAVDSFANSAQQPPGPDQSAWYCRGSDRLPPTHLRCTRLPDRATAAAMITGDFDFSNR